MLKKILRHWESNQFEKRLAKAAKEKKRRILIAWNRGLGDIALGLYALVFRIREVIPDAEITFLTRQDLEEGFSLLQNVTIRIAPTWKRREPHAIEKSLASQYDLVIGAPDPTNWVRWQLGTLTPRLAWNRAWDEFCESFPLLSSHQYIGMQPQTETLYGYEKNWPLSHWKELIEILTVRRGMKVVLFGHKKDDAFSSEGVIDLRGETTLLQMLAIIKNKCHTLIVPDSGVLSLTYFLDTPFPLKIISLWSDPRQGVLKQNVPSPNPALVHTPLLAPQEDLRRLTVQEVLLHA